MKIGMNHTKIQKKLSYINSIINIQIILKLEYAYKKAKEKRYKTASDEIFHEI